MTVYFDYPVDWGAESNWKTVDAGSTWGGVSGFIDPSASNPVDYYKSPGRNILVELSSFGPRAAWIGRLLWVSSDS